MAIFLTLVLLAYGYVALIIPVGAPFIAVILIYFLWKNKFDQEKLEVELDEIKKLLSEQKTNDNKELPPESESNEDNTDGNSGLPKK